MVQWSLPLVWAAVRIFFYKIFCAWRRAPPGERACGTPSCRVLYQYFRRRAVEWVTSRVVCLGFDGAGKTSLLLTASREQGAPPSLKPVVPTTGFHVRSINVPPACRLEVWDLGGASTVRPFWSRYVTRDTEGVIWVVDCCDAGRVSDSCALMLELLQTHVLLRGLPVLVLLNKAEQAPAAALKQAEQAFTQATAALGSRPYRVQSCSAADGRNLEEALQWLADRLSEDG